jgi:autotransporter-associated beta strand protein
MILNVLIVVSLMAYSAQAVTYLWDGGGADNNWSSAANWNPDASAPVSASNTVVQVDGANRLSMTQDVANPFILNRLEFNNGQSAGVKTPFTLSGSPLQFVADGATQPSIKNPREAIDVVSTAIDIPAGTTLSMDFSTWGVSFTGVISGGGVIDKASSSGYLNLYNGANSFSGGLTVRAPNEQYYVAGIYASNAMGTGPVSLYGGAVSTNVANPFAGLLFYNTTSHTNPISLFQNSPIGAGDLTTAGIVTLSGGINLSSYTLYLRGIGSGTVSGAISGGGSDAISKIDAGTWTLSGTNTFAGRATVANGTFRLGAPDALNAAVPVTLAGGTFDLNGCRQTISQLRGDTVAGTNTATSATAATLTVNQSSDTLFNGRLTGLLGLVKTGTGSLTLSNSLSTTTGDITVSNGTLAVAAATGLGGSTNITVAGGTLDLRVAATIADTAALRIAAGGATVSIGAGITETVDNLFLDGVQQLPGTYGAVGSGAGTETNAFFAGSGKLTVLGSLSPVVYLWDGGGADDNWNSVANWNPDTSAPVSKYNTVVQLDGTNRVTATQNIAAPFVLNRLDFSNGPGNFDKPTFILSGGLLQFAANGSTQPRITRPRQSNIVINNAIDIPTGTTLGLQFETSASTFNGAISGGGAIDKLQYNGTFYLNNSANSFSGGLTVRGIDADYYQVRVTANNAMGTGPVSLYGGALKTNVTYIGGLIFSGITSHTNAISLFQNSPIDAGDLTTAGIVTLSGGIDLNAYTLYLRGCGIGTISGAISEGGADAINKIDPGTWTLSGTNTFAGRVTVANGALRLGAVSAMNPAVPVTVSGGTYDLGGLFVSNAAVTLSAGSIINGSLQASSYSATDSGLVSATLGGPSGLAKSGVGTLTLRGVQAFTGPLAVNAGKVDVQPGPVPGSALWFDATSPFTLAKNADGTGGTPASGGTVGRWTSLNGNLWASASSGTPTYQTNVVNGLPVLRFTGGGLNFNSVVAAQGSTVFLVYRDRNPTGTWRNVLGSNGQTPTSGWMHSLNNLNNRCLTKGGGAIILDSTESTTNWAVQTLQVQVGDYRLWVNENSYGPNTSTTNFTPFTGLGDGGLTADFAEILVYTNLLNASDRVSTIRYLRRKWLGEGEAFAVTNSLSPQVAATVKSGAALNLWGGAQTVASLSGSGTVTGGTVTVTGTLAAGDTNTVASALSVGGNLTLAAGVTNAVDYVSGTSDVVNVTGTLSVSGSGTVALSLNGQTPPPQMTLFTFGTLSGESNLTSWSVQGEGLKPYKTRIKVVGTSVVLNVFRGGAFISLR